MGEIPDSTPTGLPPRWQRALAGPTAACVVLVLFWACMLSSLRDKSLTSDELGHAVAGYTYWKFNDYRLNPENGILPQRLMGLPLVLGSYQAPARDTDLWHGSEQWLIGDQWFHHQGNDVRSILRRGRAMMGLVAVALGAVVWWSARRWFGPTAGMLALLLYVANPTILANGALMTADATCSLFLFASVLALWAVLQRLSVARILISGLAMGCLFASKATAALIVPIGCTLILIRLLKRDPLCVAVGRTRLISGAPRKAAAVTAIVVVHAVMVWAVIWACYGFRYSAFAPPVAPQDRLQFSWDFVLGKPQPQELLAKLNLAPDQQGRADGILGRYNLQQDGATALDVIERDVLSPAQARELTALRSAPAPGLIGRVVDAFRARHVLPEAYLYGWADAWRFSQRRAAFLNGEYGLYGWKRFFPYTFAVKTPLPVFGVMLLAIAAAAYLWRCHLEGETSVARRLWHGFYATAPLWVLLGFYWAAAIATRLNIGHRHLMPIYAPLFVLCGVAAYGWRGGTVSVAVPTGSSPPRRHRWVGLTMGGLVLALIIEVAARYPNYLAYFNGIVAPAHAYQHLTDSSLDWGQDLPGVAAYLRAHEQDRAAYLSYSGVADPSSYGIRAHYLYCAAGFDEPRLPIRTIQATLEALPAKVAEARRAWPDCAIVGQTSAPDGRITVYYLRDPVVPVWTGGTYIVSATMLTAVMFGTEGPMGTWNTRFETTYQELVRTIAPLSARDPGTRRQALAALPLVRWAEIFELFAEYRFARLAAFLRHRQPDAEIGYSMLVYRLADADVDRALSGPPPELGIDYPTRLERTAKASRQ